MLFEPLIEDFILPTYGSPGAAAFDIFMPSDGEIKPETEGTIIKLGFKAAVPDGKVALLLPRSGVGVKHGISLNNTVGVIDPDYRGEWMASLRIRDFKSHQWKKGDRLLQCLVLPIFRSYPELATDGLPPTVRNDGGLGSTGN